jgi:diketogulonate reductase-like aldo/keto reductase
MPDPRVSLMDYPGQHRPKDVLPACKASLAALGLDYVDLWLMHYPCANDPDSEEYSVIDMPYTATWKAMEECVDLGLVRNIGVSSGFLSANLTRLQICTVLSMPRLLQDRARDASR